MQSHTKFASRIVVVYWRPLFHALRRSLPPLGQARHYNVGHTALFQKAQQLIVTETGIGAQQADLLALSPQRQAPSLRNSSICYDTAPSLGRVAPKPPAATDCRFQMPTSQEIRRHFIQPRIPDQFYRRRQTVKVADDPLGMKAKAGRAAAGLCRTPNSESPARPGRLRLNWKR
jgi:hypothetical protein